MKFWYERGAWASKYAKKVITSINPIEVKRIVVIRHAALGDMVLVRPFLVEVRQYFPNAHIILSVVSNYLYGAPEDLADEVHVLHGNDRSGVSVRKQIQQARNIGPVDIVFDLADTTRSRFMCALTQAKLKIGFPYRGYLRPLLYDAAVWRSDFSFEAINMLDMLMLLGATPSIPPNFALPHASVGAAQCAKDIIYFPFASIKGKCWANDRFIELIKIMSCHYPSFRHVILGGVSGDESELQFSSCLDHAGNIFLQQALPLHELTDFLSSASLVVSNDTGVRNLAIATSTPTVGIFFSTVPYRYWPRYHKHEAVFRATGEQPSVGEVSAAIIKILGNGVD